MPSFSDLSPELTLGIIDALHSDTSNDAASAPLCPTPSQAMINLSCCCKDLRNLVAPKLYPKIRLQKNDKSGKSLLAIADSPWAGLVRELHFEGFTPFDDEWPDEFITLHDEDFPGSVSEVLSHLERFPKLDILTVRFRFGETSSKDETVIHVIFSDYYYIDPFHDHDQLRLLEKNIGWRALVARTYEAIAQNEQSSITTLKLFEVLPAGVSSWGTDAWARFLGGVKKFTISLRAYQHEWGGWCNTTPGYEAFINNLDQLFQHLTSVTDFCFIADRCVTSALADQDRAVIAFDVNHMPMLQRFELEYCFISKNLANFVCNHLQTLKQIRLTHCFSGYSDIDVDEHTTWATFLELLGNAIDSVEDAALEEFFISPATLGEEYCGVSNCVEIAGNDEEVELVRRTLAHDSRRRMFVYTWLDITGDWFSDEEQNLTAFLAGHDQIAFDRLMAAIKLRTQIR
jgi:hypothetical protein